MSNYFEAVTSKTAKSVRLFDFNDCDLEKLPQYLEQENTRLKNKRGKILKLEQGHKVRKLYRKWRKRMLQGYNLIIRGIGSKKRLLDKFSSRHLRRQDIIRVRLHGFEPVSEQIFATLVLKLEGKTTLNQEDLIDYTRSLSDDKKVYFIIHSLEEFYKNSRKVCEVIFELIKLAPRYVRLIASSDHINGGMLTSYYKLQLNLIFFYHTTWRSYFFERCHTIVNNQANDANINDLLIQNEFTLHSLMSVYEAIQVTNRQIMTFIMQYYVDCKDETCEIRSTRSRKSKVPNMLKLETLFKYTSREFLARGQAKLSNYLDELKDHNIIKTEGQSDSEVNVILQVPIKIAERFLEEINSLHNN